MPGTRVRRQFVRDGNLNSFGDSREAFFGPEFSHAIPGINCSQRHRNRQHNSNNSDWFLRQPPRSSSSLNFTQRYAERLLDLPLILGSRRDCCRVWVAASTEEAESAKAITARFELPCSGR